MKFKSMWMAAAAAVALHAAPAHAVVVVPASGVYDFTVNTNTLVQGSLMGYGATPSFALPSGGAVTLNLSLSLIHI